MSPGFTFPTNWVPWAVTVLEPLTTETVPVEYHAMLYRLLTSTKMPDHCVYRHVKIGFDRGMTRLVE